MEGFRFSHVLLIKLHAAFENDHNGAILVITYCTSMESDAELKEMNTRSILHNKHIKNISIILK